jgi:Fe-S cluster assembly ATP-binding protein
MKGVNMLTIENLILNYGDNAPIINDLSLTIKKGEVHVLMGKNGSGKSTLLRSLAGDPAITTQGKILLNGKKLLTMAVDERANEGMLLSFQNPLSIDGVNNIQFIKQAVNSKRHYHKLGDVEISDFMDEIRHNMSIVGFDNSFLTRNLNEGFSGGERKRNELLQILMLKPDLLLLDEIDSGVDIDGIKIIAETINKYMENGDRSILMVSHYEKIFEYIKPTKIHVLGDRKIKVSGDISLMRDIQEKGYDNVN